MLQLQAFQGEKNEEVVSKTTKKNDERFQIWIHTGGDIRP